jgi:class 3 adenylate cyclase
MSRIAAEYGGTVDKFIGDGMVIFFGDPHTLGPRGDALQCVRMAIAMQNAMANLQVLWRDGGTSKSFRIRIGINTGFCDVGNFGSNLRMDYTIIGPEVNLAARLEQAAEPGGILISGETYALVRNEIDADPSMPIDAKGFSEPIAAHAVRGTFESLQRVRPGCRDELQRLRGLLDVESFSMAERADTARELRRLADQVAG